MVFWAYKWHQNTRVFWGEVDSYRNPAIQVTSWDSMWKIESTINHLKKNPGFNPWRFNLWFLKHQQSSAQILPRRLLGGSSQDLFQWLITITLVSPQDLGLFWTPFIHGRNLWLINGGWPQLLTSRGMIRQVLAVWKTPEMTLRLRTNHVDEFLLKEISCSCFFKLCTLEETKDQDLLAALYIDLPNISGT